jgi:hypothetical protein
MGKEFPSAGGENNFVVGGKTMVLLTTVCKQKGELQMKRSINTHKVAAAFTMGLMTFAGSDSAMAALKFKDMTNNITDSAAGLPATISMVSYIAGTGLAVAGIFKCKNHVDNPGQTPLKDGLIRLGAGGGLLSLPFITSAMQGSISDGDNVALDTGTLVMQDTTGFGGL